MNAQLVWDRLQHAYLAGDWNGIEEHAEALMAWLDEGGVPPRVVVRNDLQDWDRALAQAGCQFALEAIHGRWHIPCNHGPG